MGTEGKEKKGTVLFFATPQDARRERDDRLEEVKKGRDRYPNKPERQGNKPDDGVKKEGQQSQRPANHQEKQPK
jgi:hypothetical protein